MNAIATRPDGAPVPVKTVSDFEDGTIAVGRRAVLVLAGSGVKVRTSPVIECVFHPYERTCWIRTLNTVYTTDPSDRERYVRELWAYFGDAVGCDDGGCIDRNVELPGLGWYPAGANREEIWHDFEDELGIPVHDLMFPDERADHMPTS